jgi:ABC-type transport system involved in cytochrome c biogenesis ATPase subunit
LRKIFGLVQNEDGSWRIRMNYELIGNADIVRFIKSRMAWLGHMMQMDDKRTPNRILQWKPIGTRTRGRPRKRWIAGTEEGLQIMGVRRW